MCYDYMLYMQRYETEEGQAFNKKLLKTDSILYKKQ